MTYFILFFFNFKKTTLVAVQITNLRKTGNGSGAEIMDMGRVVIQSQTLGYCSDNKKNEIGLYVLV